MIKSALYFKLFITVFICISNTITASDVIVKIPCYNFCLNKNNYIEKKELEEIVKKLLKHPFEIMLINNTHIALGYQKVIINKEIKSFAVLCSPVTHTIKGNVITDINRFSRYKNSSLNENDTLYNFIKRVKSNFNINKKYIITFCMSKNLVAFIKPLSETAIIGEFVGYIPRPFFNQEIRAYPKTPASLKL